MTIRKNTAGQLAILILSSFSKKLLHHHMFEHCLEGRTHFALCRSGFCFCEQLYWIQCRSILMGNGPWTMDMDKGCVIWNHGKRLQEQLKEWIIYKKLSSLIFTPFGLSMVCLRSQLFVDKMITQWVLLSDFQGFSHFCTVIPPLHSPYLTKPSQYQDLDL